MASSGAGFLKRGLRYAARLPAHFGARVAAPLLGTIQGVVTEEKIAALTFDDGPHPEYTPRLLDILAAHGAKATFFVVGAAVRAHPELTRRIASEGHALANHTWDHRSMPTLTRVQRLEQLRRCAHALAPYGGDHHLFRPPFGNQSLASRLDALRLGYEVVTWSYHCLDWLEHDAEFLSARLAERLRPGSIVLLHDALYRVAEPGRANRLPTLGAVEHSLQTFSDYSFVTVPTLLAHGKLRKTMWFKEPDAAWLARFDHVEEPYEA